MSNKAAAHRACQTGPALRASASIAKSVSLPLVVPNFRHKRHEQTCETASPGRLSLSLSLPGLGSALSLSLCAFCCGIQSFPFRQGPQAQQEPLENQKYDNPTTTSASP